MSSKLTEGGLKAISSHFKGKIAAQHSEHTDRCVCKYYMFVKDDSIKCDYTSKVQKTFILFKTFALFNLHVKATLRKTDVCIACFVIAVLRT